MKKYNPKSGSRTRIEYGIELDAGLKAFAETTPLVEALAEVNRRLEEAYQARLDAGVDVVRARSGLRVAEFLVDREIRSFARILEAAEGGRRGPAFDAVLPAGLNAAVYPRRADQARELHLILERLAGCALPAARAVAVEWLPRLTAEAERFDAAVVGHAGAVEAHEQAFRLELRRREEHERAVDEMIGRVRAAFPQDRNRQDAVFPTGRPRLAGSDEDENGEPVGPEPPPLAPPAPVP